MPSTSFAFDPDELSGEFTLEDDADPTEWPEIEVEFDYKFQPAEPEVGIFHSPLDITDTRYLVDGVAFGTEEEFVAMIFEAIGDQIEQGQDFVAGVVAKQIKVWQEELDGGDE